jgi:ABC-type transporter Mla maintaining outer membrane lipid asymmetry ATPase subunit MlaF
VIGDTFAVLDAGRILAGGTIDALDASDDPLVQAFMGARGGG